MRVSNLNYNAKPFKPASKLKPFKTTFKFKPFKPASKLKKYEDYHLVSRYELGKNSSTVCARAATEMNMRCAHIKTRKLNLDSGHRHWMQRIGKHVSPVSLTLDAYGYCKDNKLI